MQDNSPLLGYVYNADGRHNGKVYLKASQLPAFLMAHEDAPRVVVTDPLDCMVLTTFGNLIDQWEGDSQYLQMTLLPALIPMQMGQREALPFQALTEQEWLQLR